LGDRSRWPARLVAFLVLIATGCNFQAYVQSEAGPATSATPGGVAVIAPTETIEASPPIGTNPPLASLTFTPAPSAPLAVPSGTLSPTPCTDFAAFVDDVTIRDNTLVVPGASFVKIWRLQNAGTCTWDPTYMAAFIGGERLEAASPVHLTTTVPPGATIDVAVDMEAPLTPGTYQGFWKLIGRAGRYFGIGSEAEAAFWVKIVVPALPTEAGAPTPTLTPTASATPKATPEVIASGPVSLTLNTSMDLDTGKIDPTSGSDASLVELTPGAPSLVPADGVQMSRYGPPPDPPSPSRCQALDLTGDPIPLSSLSVQGLVCYRTSAGRLGYFRVRSLDQGLGIEFVTWGP
jgi:hypothetical protein